MTVPQAARGAPTLGADARLVEITGFPPPMGSWALRALLLAARWRELGGRIDLVNIGPSRTLEDPAYVNIRGGLDLCWRTLRYARSGWAIHTHTNAKGLKGTIIALVLQLIALPFGRRTALTFHAGHVQDYFPRTGRRWLDLLMRLVFRTPRVVICNSLRVKQHIVEDYGIAAEKVHAIQAFCQAYLETEREPTFAPETADFMAAHDPVILTYVSSFAPEFRVPETLDLLQRLRREGHPRAGLLNIGNERFMERFGADVERRGLADAVGLTGDLDRPEFLGLMERATLFLRTPVGDGVAASVLEALSLRTPVVASDNGTRPEGCALFRDGDPDDMEARVREVLADREEAVARIPDMAAFDTLDDEVRVLHALLPTRTAR